MRTLRRGAWPWFAAGLLVLVVSFWATSEVDDRYLRDGSGVPLTAYAVVALSCLVAGWLVGRWPVLVLAAIPGLVSLLFGYADVPDVDDAGFYFAYRVSKHSLIFTPAFAAMIGLGVALSRLRTWFTRRVAPTA
ncbi:MAG: hypothetical protein EXQ70_05165 [Solirubrobacterales bacterium]|nr:hypothetical protein [Solirubrobacterales bacterium]